MASVTQKAPVPSVAVLESSRKSAASGSDWTVASTDRRDDQLGKKSVALASLIRPGDALPDGSANKGSSRFLGSFNFFVCLFV